MSAQKSGRLRRATVIVMALSLVGCATIADLAIKDHGASDETEQLAIFYWDTPEYRAFAETFAITPEEACELIRQQLHAHGAHYVIVDRSYVFSFADEKLLQIDLSGYYVNADTGAVTQKFSLPDIPYHECRRRWPGKKLRPYPFLTELSDSSELATEN